MCLKHQRCSLRNSRLIPKRVARARTLKHFQSRDPSLSAPQFRFLRGRKSCVSFGDFDARSYDGSSGRVNARLAALKQRLNTSYRTTQQQQFVECYQQQLCSPDGSLSFAGGNNNAPCASLHLADTTNGTEHSTRRDSIKSNVTPSHAAAVPPSAQRIKRRAPPRPQQRSSSQWIILGTGLCK